MKKLFLWTILLASAIVVPMPTVAEVNISIGIPLPPPIVFGAPPEVVVIPETDYVYVVPDVDVDIFFWDGWWWRPWEGRWYRSHYYNRGWAYYNNVPSFYFDVDPGWRGYYRERNWYGHRWNYERIPNRQLRQNWRSWHDDRHWERHGAWGIQGYQPRPQQQRQELRHQRQEQYQQRPDVQRHRQQIEQHQRQPQGQPAERGRTMAPRSLGRGEGRQVQPEERGRTMTPHGAPMGRGERQQVQPAERGRPQGGPAPRGESQGKPQKRTKPEGGRESRDERRPER